MSLPVDVALGKADYLEVVGFSDHKTTAEVWYRLLNCGFRLPAGAGTDAMANYASLRGPVGMNRVFVRSGQRLDYRSWLDGVQAGRTFVSNGPTLEFTLDGREVGDEITLPAGKHRLTARVRMRTIAPVEKVEIVANGKVVATIPVTSGGTRVDATVPLTISGSGWYTLRAWSSKAVEPVLDLYPFATTSPIYVSVAAGPSEIHDDARYFARWVERLQAAAARARRLERRSGKGRGPRRGWRPHRRDFRGTRRVAPTLEARREQPGPERRAGSSLSEA